MAGAEATVADDALGGFLALLEVATGLARRHCGGNAGDKRLSAEVGLERRREPGSLEIGKSGESGNG